MSYFVIATAQFLSPSAAADPASRINPPEWSYREVQGEIQAQEIESIAEELEESNEMIVEELKGKTSVEQF